MPFVDPDEAEYGDKLLQGLLIPIRDLVLAGLLGGDLDGRNRYPMEKYLHAPDMPDPHLGRCSIEGKAWDDHVENWIPGGPTCRGKVL